MTLNRTKLGRAVIFMEYLANIASLIFLAKTLICNKIIFAASNELNLVELVVMNLQRVSTKKFTIIPFFIGFITS